jgi:hypothetical protein
MADASLKRKSVVFNLADDYQRRLYEHAMKATNFSYYIKTLIQRDMETQKPAEGQRANR